MASMIAKRLLNGEEITVVNAEKAVLSGRRKSKTKEAKEFLDVGSPKMGPLHYRRPDRIVRRTVRACSPTKNQKVSTHTKGLRCSSEYQTSLKIKRQKPWQMLKPKS